MHAADDFPVIRARMEQLQRERLTRRESEQGTARTDAHIGATNRKAVEEIATNRKAVEEIKARITERNRLWMAQQR